MTIRLPKRSEYVCESASCGGHHEGRVIEGRWRGRLCREWSIPVRYCQGALKRYSYLVEDWEWNPKEEDSLSPPPNKCQNVTGSPACGWLADQDHEGVVQYGRFVLDDFRLPQGYCCERHIYLYCLQDPARRRFEHLNPPSEKKDIPAPVPAKPARTHWFYCENAPPREVVEGTIVRCGSGLHEGIPVMGSVAWTPKMTWEYERHTAFMIAGFALPRFEIELPPPEDADRYGGFVTNERSRRCALCGGWMRTKKVT